MLNKDELFLNIANNLVYYRKKAGLTQLELAEKLNYSDKTISKWERSESLPDIYVLYELCSLYKISLNDLVYKKKKDLPKYNKFHKRMIMILSISLVWLIATIIFTSFFIFLDQLTHHWLTFIYAVPVSFTIFLVFSLLWERKRISFIALTGIITTIPVSVALSLDLLLGFPEIWYILLIIAPLEVLALFWFIFKDSKKKFN